MRAYLREWDEEVRKLEVLEPWQELLQSVIHSQLLQGL